jgi:translation initiation factor 2B subunit (eIF-2B alpha/beta/delta family)
MYGNGLDTKKRIYLSQVINNLQLEAYPSATDVANSFINTILFISDSKNFLKNCREAYRNIQIDQIKMVKKIMKARPSHYLVRRIYKIVRDDIKANPSKLTDKEIQIKLNKLHQDIANIKKYRAERLKKLYQDGKSLFADPGAILLFGHSKLVVNVLKGVDEKIKNKTDIYICEGKNVCQYNDMNDLRYCDGIEYAKNIKEAGYDNINLIPDILVENLMKRRIIKKVAFGANGVDYESGNFYHTAGHGTIAQLAKINAIPVYVIVDSLKIGNVKKYYKDNTIRETKWIAGYEKSYPELKIELDNPREDELEKDKASIIKRSVKKDLAFRIKLFNPREDEIEQDKVSLLITDFGIFPPCQLKDRIRAKEFLIDPPLK